MKVSASLDYALRAMVELAAARPGEPVKADDIAARQTIPSRFLAQLLAELRRANLVSSGRGYAGGYWLAVEPSTVTVADIVRVIDGPLADVHGMSPEVFMPPGVAAPTKELWIAVRAALRSVMEQVTIADLAAGKLPDAVTTWLDDPDAWTRRTDPTHRPPEGTRGRTSRRLSGAEAQIGREAVERR